jgi:peptide/nickel transport system substrate-binding protein
MKNLLAVLAISLVCSLIITGCGTTTASTPAAASQTSTPSAAPPPKSSNTPSSSTAPAPSGSAVLSKYGGMARYAEANGPSLPIGMPAECYGPSSMTAQLCLQTLLKEQLDGSLTPGLASSYDVVTDSANPSLTFHLQKGIKFSDGSDFNAQAVKWNLDKIKPSSFYLSTTNNWKSIEVIDEYTVRVNFNTWQNGVIRRFADPLAYQISPTAFDKNGIEWIRWHLVGTGPFLQTDFQRDVSLTAVKNPNYWEKGKPYLDGFKYVFVADESTRNALFKSGGVEAYQISGNIKTATELKDAGYNIVTQLNGPGLLLMDSVNADSPWSNLKVRQAAEYAIDRESIAATFGFGWWKAVYQFSTPSSKAYDPTITPRKYDVAKAKQLLAEAGYPSGFKTTLISSAMQSNRNIVLAIQANLADIGIQADVQFPEMAKWTEISSNPWKNAVLYTSVFESGNQNETFNSFMGVPVVNWKSVIRPTNWKETLDASKASPAQDPVLLKKLETMIYDNVMCIPVISGTVIWAQTKNLHDIGSGTRGQSYWIEAQDTWLSK